jgi:acyl-coenzyme A synthetase/AMP-(fatty) acid ligase
MGRGAQGICHTEKWPAVVRQRDHRALPFTSGSLQSPKAVEFGPLPKTSTGKVQKYLLREREWKGREKRIN